MNLSGLTTSLKNNADNIGYLAGVVTNNNITLLVSSIQQLMAGVIHAPNMTAIQDWAMNDGKNALLLYIAGVGLEGFNLPVVGSLGTPLQKAAVAYATATGAIRLFYAATHSEIKGINIETTAPSIRQNFANAPLAQSYY